MNALTRSSWISSNGRQTLPSNNSVCRRGTFEGLTLFRCVCMCLFPLCAVLYALFSLCAVTCILCAYPASCTVYTKFVLFYFKPASLSLNCRLYIFSIGLPFSHFLPTCL